MPPPIAVPNLAPAAPPAAPPARPPPCLTVSPTLSSACQIAAPENKRDNQFPFSKFLAFPTYGDILEAGLSNLVPKSSKKLPALLNIPLILSALARFLAVLLNVFWYSATAFDLLVISNKLTFSQYF